MRMTDWILLKAGDLLLGNLRFRVEGGESADMDTVLVKSKIEEVCDILDEVLGC